MSASIIVVPFACLSCGSLTHRKCSQCDMVSLCSPECEVARSHLGSSVCAAGQQINSTFDADYGEQLFLYFRECYSQFAFSPVNIFMDKRNGGLVPSTAALGLDFDNPDVPRYVPLDCLELNQAELQLYYSDRVAFNNTTTGMFLEPPQLLFMRELAAILQSNQFITVLIQDNRVCGFTILSWVARVYASDDFHHEQAIFDTISYICDGPL